MSEPSTKVVLVGCGGMSRVWLDAAAQIENLEIVGLVDISQDAAAQRSIQYDLKDAIVSTDIHAVLEQTSPDVVFDCSIPSVHTDVALAAFQHGCHVLSEKPLSDTYERAKAAVAAASAAGVTYAVMQNRRYDWRIQRLRRLIKSDSIGDLTTLHSDFFLGPHFGGFREEMKHVLLLDMAIHTFDAARFILGADPVSVWAKEWNPSGSWYRHDASAVAYFQMSSGIVYTYRGSWCAQGLSTTWESDWRILGTLGSIKWDGNDMLMGEAVTVDNSGKPFTPLTLPERDESDKDGGHAGLIKDFIRSIRAGEAVDTVASDNIKSLAMVLAAIESSETGKTVQI